MGLSLPNGTEPSSPTNGMVAKRNRLVSKALFMMIHLVRKPVLLTGSKSRSTHKIDTCA